MARNTLAKKIVEPVAAHVVFNFADSNQLIVPLASLSPEITKRLALYGIAQKIGDAYAGAANAAEAFASASAVYQSLLAGEFNTARSSAAVAESTMFEAAYLRVLRTGITGIVAPAPETTLAEAITKLSTKSDEARKALKRYPAIVAAMGEIRTERAQAAATESGAPTVGDLF